MSWSWRPHAALVTHFTGTGFAFGFGGVLLAIDAALISGDIFYRHEVLADRRFSVNLERGFGEMFEYAKLTIAAAVLGWTALRWHSWGTGFWAVLFAYLVIDNAFAVTNARVGSSRASFSCRGWATCVRRTSAN